MFKRNSKPTKELTFTLEEPVRPACIPTNCQWLSGEGAGSWFHISFQENNFLITRYNPKGKIECSGFFKISNNIPFDIDASYNFIHISHCKSVNIIQNNQVIHMIRLS